jgi:FkbM family methyltransferase
MMVLDIGAHHGLYTLLASKLVGRRGKVIAFEPSPRERERLKKNLRLNGCRNVRVEPVALGSQKGLADLYVVDGAQDWCNSLRPPMVSGATHTVQVPVRRLDEVLLPKYGQRIDFIKLDAEGAELGVLQGAGWVFDVEPRPIILVEVEDLRTRPWGYEAKEIFKFLMQRRYQLFALGREGQLARIDPDKKQEGRNVVAIPEERQASLTSLNYEK